MPLHPLVDLANSRDVKQAKGFRQVAETLTGESLNVQYRTEVANAPKRAESGKFKPVCALPIADYQLPQANATLSRDFVPNRSDERATMRPPRPR